MTLKKPGKLVKTAYITMLAFSAYFLFVVGGVFAGERKVESVNESIDPEEISGEGVILRKGKKGYCRIRRA